MSDYKRILLKLSGESLMGNDGYGINYDAVRHYASEIAAAIKMKKEVGVVIGGGNIFRGVSGASSGFSRVQGDYMGMMATVINAMALQTVLGELGVESKILTGVEIEGVTEKAYFRKAIEYIEKGVVVLFGAGTGSPFFTTDSAAALRAAEIGADVLFKGTRVDGVYTADPEKDPTATKYQKLSFNEVIDKRLKIMDLTAFTLCQENHIPIYVYCADVAGNLEKVLQGETIGTLVY